MSGLASVAPRVAKLVSMLGSDRDGEIVATAKAIGRALKAVRLDFHDLARAVSGGPPATPPRGVVPPCMTWADLARWCRAEDRGRLAPREREFVADMTARLRPGASLSDRQAGWLLALYRKLDGGAHGRR